jgi:hypothetical protein
MVLHLEVDGIVDNCCFLAYPCHISQEIVFFLPDDIIILYPGSNQMQCG